jgi:ATP-dependent Lon protease
MARDTGNKLSKKEQIKKTKKAEEINKKKKKNVNSDDDGDDFISEDESDEMDVHEYRKFLSKIFPSKHLDKKIEAGEKIKKLKKGLSEIDDEDDDEYEEDDDDDSSYVDEKETKKSKQKLKPKSKSKPAKKSKKIVESESEEDLSTDEDEDEEEENIIITRSKSKKNKKVIESDSEDEDEEDEEDEDDDDDEEFSKKGSEKLNIIFTIGGADDEDEWEDYDSDYDDDEEDEETEDEDVSVSSASSSEDEDEDDKNKKNKKKEKTKSKNPTVKKALEKVDKKKNNKEKKENKDEENEDKEDNQKGTLSKQNSSNTLDKLKNLANEDPNNKIMKKCIELCEEEIKKTNAKKEKKLKKQKAKNSRIFKKILRDKNTMNDFKFFDNLDMEYQKKIIKELREINKLTRIEKPYRMTLLESNIPTLFKSAAMKKVNSLRYMEPGSGEFYKIKNWVDTFMRIPFGKAETLPICIEDGVEKCHEFMENAQKTLDKAVYGLNDAKMQIMQMLGQLLTNPKAIGTAIAIHGPPGTGKTSLVKEGISKILNRPFAFIALGGATDSSFLEGHSYTYEGSTWGKIVQILIDSKCMNPVIYFDELDKISDTPRGEEIAGILTHLTDTSQNSQFHDKYFAEIDFDLSKCLFIFSYNDESKVNPILKDRMYRIQTKGYNQKQKIQIANNYLLSKIREQVKFNEDEIIIPDDVVQYLIDNHCNKEDGVRNLKRCLEIIYTKLNLYRLMKPGTNLFEEDMSLSVTFPLTVTKEIVDKLIKLNKENVSALYNMYV